MAEASVRQLDDLSSQLRALGEQMRYATCFEAKQFTQGIIAFSAKPGTSKQIAHEDKDVLCFVISGTGRLYSGPKELILKQGSICHIPSNTPHDFQATGDRELVLLYTLVEVAPQGA